MKRSTIPYFRRMATSSLALSMLALSMSILADEPDQTIPDPGFRPESEYAEIFLDAVGTATIAVLPTLVRRSERTAHSFASQQQIAAFLNEYGIAEASTKPLRIDLGPIRRPSQWEIFQYGAGSVAAKLKAYETGAEYTLVMELLVPGYQAVFGIEVYIVNTQGQSAFSFLLNSHHEIFSDANLYTENSSEESRDEMIANATRVGLVALKSQIEQAREHIAAAAATKAVKTEAGHDDVTARPAFIETPIDKNSSRLTIDASQGDQLVVEKVMKLTCECASLTLDRGFRYYVIDEQTRLSGDRSSFRITFYSTLPEGIPVATHVVRESGARQADLDGTAIDAAEMDNICRLMQSEPGNRDTP